MKGFLLLMLWVALSAQQMVHAETPNNAGTEIELVESKDLPVKGDPITRNLPVKLMRAYLYNGIINIQFYMNTTSPIKIEIVRSQTGMTVYSRIIQQGNISIVDLDGWQSGEYKICIHLDGRVFEGKFVL